MSDVTFEVTGFLCGGPRKPAGAALRMGVLRCSSCGKEVHVVDTQERIERAARSHVCAGAEVAS